MRISDWSSDVCSSDLLLANTVVYLAAAVIAVPIAKRLRLGSVLGYLIAGIIVGPWRLQLITDVEAILHFSEFGVVMLLFVIGLELNPRRLWQMRGPITGLGAGQVGLPALALAAIFSSAVGRAPASAGGTGLGSSLPFPPNRPG